MILEQIDFLTPAEAYRGPDLFRPGCKEAVLDPTARTFVLTRSGGWFAAPAHVGHEHLATVPEVVVSMFGLHTPSVHNQAGYTRPVYRSDPSTGFVVAGPDGQPAVEKTVYDLDAQEVRRMAIDRHNLLGRAGRLRGRPVVLLWHLDPADVSRLPTVLSRLGVGPDVVVGVGRTRQYVCRQ
jgi:hypothetical protein